MAKVRSASRMQLFRTLTAALLTHVVIVYSHVVYGCASCCGPRRALDKVNS